MVNITVQQYDLVYNAFSFTIAAMGAATIFFFLGRSQVSAGYRTALTITGLVTLIATYHYFRIFQSWEASYSVLANAIKPTGYAFTTMMEMRGLVIPLLVPLSQDAGHNLQAKSH